MLITALACGASLAALLAFPSLSAASPSDGLRSTLEAVDGAVSEVAEQPPTEAVPVVQDVVETAAPVVERAVDRVRTTLQSTIPSEPVKAVGDTAAATIEGATTGSAVVRSEAGSEAKGAAIPSQHRQGSPAGAREARPSRARASGGEVAAASARSVRETYAALPPLSGGIDAAPARADASGAGGSALDEAGGGSPQASASASASPGAGGFAGAAILLASSLILLALAGKRLPRLSASWAPAAFLQPIERPG